MGTHFEFADRGVLTDSAEIWQVASHINELQNRVSVFLIFCLSFKVISSFVKEVSNLEHLKL